MKKNTLYRIYSAVFIGACIAPAVLMPFSSSDGSMEKRELAKAPSLHSEDGSLNEQFFSQFDDWFSEHFAFRQQLVTADGRLKTALFNTSPDTDVIYGTDGWLYYGETTDDFLNINTLSQREINGIVHDLRLVDEYCRSLGADFIFTVAPNKSSVYPEHMPSNYAPADEPDNYALLSSQLSDTDFFCDMKDALISAGSNIPLYHKTDTHWNGLGAYAGHTALMRMLGHDVCPAGDWYTRDDRLGDLAAMIYPSEPAKDTQVYSSYEYTYSYQGRFRALDDITINTISPSGSGDLLMFRDSYGEAILPYMAEVFETAEFSRVVPYRIENIGSDGYDTVILEIVERNIPRLAASSPIMPAPEVQLPDGNAQAWLGELDEKENSSRFGGLTIKAEESGSYIRIYGALPELFFSDSSHRILITAGESTYEAFCGSELADSGNGFSAYLPADTDISAFTVICDNAEGADMSVWVTEDMLSND
ncbi:MAG: hypothetical protein IJ874_06070 [Ruminococcus sp.]|nr:hypothetical protein [Ruminococcus sp.]